LVQSVNSIASCYDQLNRIKQQHETDTYDYDYNKWIEPSLSGLESCGDYFMQFDYDPNGNILSMQRNGNATMNHNGLGVHELIMDKLTYNYNTTTDINGVTHLLNNKLRSVQDGVVGSANVNGSFTDNAEYANDIEDQTASGTALDNYEYDEIGNLIADHKGEIKNMEWTLYGKVKKVTKDNGNLITFAYDAAGNRIKKTTEIKGYVTATYYTRDAQGNVLAIYINDQDGNNEFYLSEVPLYGSSRLGEWRPRRLLDIVAAENTVTTLSGEKTYELSNHLGNVLAVVSDALIDNAPSVVSATDYYAFGQEMPGRIFNDKDYRYGYQGQEQEDDIWESGVAYKYRISDSRLGRFFSVDPLTAKYPFYSTYAFSGNRVIDCVELEGLEPLKVFPTPDAAADDFGKLFNDNSIRAKKEYYTEIYPAKDSKGKILGYMYAIPISSAGASVDNVETLQIPKHIRSPKQAVAWAHTHANYDPKFDNENFSLGDDDDAGFSKSNRFKKGGIPGYVSTPGGLFKKYYPKNGKIEILSKKHPKDLKSGISLKTTSRYEVQTDDSLLSIAKRYHTSAKKIIEENKITKNITVGQKLNITN
jgi:RHS repeat-associated protein